MFNFHKLEHIVNISLHEHKEKHKKRFHNSVSKQDSHCDVQKLHCVNELSRNAFSVSKHTHSTQQKACLWIVVPKVGMLPSLDARKTQGLVMVLIMQ